MSSFDESSSSFPPKMVLLPSLGFAAPADLVPPIMFCGRDVGGHACKREPGHQGPCLHSLVRYGGKS